MIWAAGCKGAIFSGSDFKLEGVMTVNTHTPCDVASIRSFLSNITNLPRMRTETTLAGDSDQFLEIMKPWMSTSNFLRGSRSRLQLIDLTSSSSEELSMKLQVRDLVTSHLRRN